MNRLSGEPGTSSGATARGAEPTGAALVLAAGAGDQQAWAELVLRYESLVWARVRAFRLQEADALDAVQETWLRLAENIRRLRGRI